MDIKPHRHFILYPLSFILYPLIGELYSGNISCISLTLLRETILQS